MLEDGIIIPANTVRWNNDVLMLGQRRRRWANIKTLLFQRVVFAGMVLDCARLYIYVSLYLHLLSLNEQKRAVPGHLGGDHGSYGLPFGHLA